MGQDFWIETILLYAFLKEKYWKKPLIYSWTGSVVFPPVVPDQMEHESPPQHPQFCPGILHIRVDMLLELSLVTLFHLLIASHST